MQIKYIEHMKNYNILDILSLLRLSIMLKRRPLDINIETYSYCPMKCVFCCNRIYERKRTLMNLRLFEKVVKEYCDLFGGGAIGIGSMQSDFLSDPLLLERIDILKKYKSKLYVHSTTPLITCQKYTDDELIKILEIFDFLEISVEGHDEESYHKMAGVNGFNILQRQLERVKRLLVENNLKCYIKISFRTYDARKVKGSQFYREQKSHYKNDVSIKNEFFSWFGTIKQEDLVKGAKLIKKSNLNERENCAVPWATLAVQANGKVVGCGCIDWLEKNVVGDCKKQKLDIIWTSKKAKAFRNAFKNRKLPGICKECGLYISTSNAFARRQLLKYKPIDGVYYNIK